ncbi:Tryptophan--tRNA ligase [Syntrophobacter sp. SbD1]|nr:Tryptophan--tRNA ligase [Syntrophobacter sp. SbD1]
MADRKRILSGMRPTGRLHLGNLHGALANWVQLQDEYDCYFFVADWHALTTDYASPESIRENTWEMVLDWLSAGLDPQRCTMFIQSDIKEHAELYLLLAMITPLPWLERNPTYKEQQQQLDQKDLATYGFLGYPVLQAADIIIYRANGVPVGKDQLPHIELTREIARRFNFMYKSEIFPIPDGLLTDSPVLPGLDGRKMSKSYGNCIFITESEKEITEKISKMMTDPQRVRRHDPGDPEISPVFAYHKLYSSPAEIEQVADGCRTAGIGCVECKKILIRNVISRLAPMRQRRLELESEIGKVKEIIAAGNERARRESAITMELVREAIGI